MASSPKAVSGWLPKSYVRLAAQQLCLASSPTAVFGWQPKCCVQLAAQMLCPAGCPKAVSGWLPKSYVRLAAQMLCLASSPTAVFGWQPNSCVWLAAQMLCSAGSPNAVFSWQPHSPAPAWAVRSGNNSNCPGSRSFRYPSSAPTGPCCFLASSCAVSGERERLRARLGLKLGEPGGLMPARNHPTRRHVASRAANRAPTPRTVTAL